MKRVTVHRNLWAFLLCLPVFLCGFTTPGAAQNQAGSISGTLTDPAGAVLRGAQVSIAGKGLNTNTDQQGLFFFGGLPAGDYTLSVSYVGFQKLAKTVAVISGQITTVKLELQVASEEQSVLVTAASASAQVEAVNEERAADNIVQVMPVQVMTALPNQTLGDAIGRLPSVSLTRNEGQDQFVQVRGTEPRLTNTTIDGFNMPSEDPGVREVELDVIPSGIIDSVQISKTLQANVDGDGIGGSVNIVTKTASDTPTIEISGVGGYTPIQNGRPNTEEYGTFGRRFGASKKFGFVIGADYTWDGRAINDTEPTPDIATLSNGQTVGWFTNQDLREYQFHRPRWGVAGSLDYRLRPGSNIFLRYIYSDFHDFGDKGVWSLHDNTPGIQLLAPQNSGCSGTDANGATAPPCTAPPTFYNQDEHITMSVGSIQLSGNHVFNNTWYAWNAAIGTALWEGAWRTSHFANTLPTSSCQFDAAATKNYHLPQWNFGECYAEFNPQYQVLSDTNYEPGHTEQINVGLAGSGAFRYHTGGKVNTLEYGAKFRTLHKYDNMYYVNVNPNPGVNIPMTTFPNRLKDPNYYNGGAYQVGYEPFYEDIAKYIQAHPTEFSVDASDKGVDPGDFGMVEHIPAAYVMNTTDFGRGVRLILGLRAEITSDDIHNLAFGPSGQATPNHFTASYYDLLPSASLRFNAGTDSFLRLIYARGVSRPEEQSLAQALDWTDNGNGGNKYQVSFGNPNLVAEVGDDIDLLYDHYFKTFGVLSAGYFYKRLTNPIIEIQHQIVNYQPPGGPQGNYLANQPVNAGSAWISGIELQYLQHYTNLPSLLGGLGIDANYSYIGSQTSGIPNRSDHPRLLDNAPNIFNVSPTYDKGPLSLRMGLNYNQANVFQYQYTDGLPGGIKGPLSDVYFYTHAQVDAQGSFQLHHGLKVIVYGLNLNNEVFGFYQGSQQFPIQREYYQPTFAAGLRWSARPEK